MTLFVKKILLTLVVLTTIFLSLKFYSMQYKAKNYLSAFVDKLRIIEDYKNKRKIVLIGGSSVGFSISAVLLESQTGLKTINLGHNANFGLVDFQEFIIKNLRKDDQIIFSPEWKFYEDPTFTDAGTLNYLINNNIGYGLLLKKKQYVLRSIFSPISIYEFSNKSMVNRMSLEKPPYVYNCINANGDIISHCHLKPKGPRLETLNVHNFNVDKFLQTFSFINRYKTALVFPPTPGYLYKKYKADLERTASELLKKDVKLLNHITDNIYPDSGFYDETNHLTCDYRVIRTKQIIKAINAK